MARGAASCHGWRVAIEPSQRTAEVAKLPVSTVGGEVLPLATTERKAEKRWRK